MALFTPQLAARLHLAQPLQDAQLHALALPGGQLLLQGQAQHVQGRLPALVVGGRVPQGRAGDAAQLVQAQHIPGHLHRLLALGPAAQVLGGVDAVQVHLV